MVWSIVVRNKLKLSVKPGEAPKLFKYGHSTLEPDAEYLAITSKPEYVDKLPFHPPSFIQQVESKLSVKGVNKAFLELYEIGSIFKLGSMTSNIKLNADLNKVLPKSKETYVHYIGNVAIDESIIVTEILNNLNKAPNAIFQVSTTMTEPSAQLIYYLASLCDNLYIYKPSIIGDLHDTKYLIMVGVHDSPKLSIKGSVSTLGLDIPNDVETIIQCMNLKLLSRKIQAYDDIKEYLKTGVSEGALKQSLDDLQDKAAIKWLDTFVKPKADLLDSLIESCSFKSAYDLDY